VVLHTSDVARESVLGRFSPEDISTAALPHMWALRTDYVVQVTSLTKQRRVRPTAAGR
jgi:hypothetical protein